MHAKSLRGGVGAAVTADYSTVLSEAHRWPESIYIDGDYFSKHPTWDVEDSAWKANQVMKMLSRHKQLPRSVCEVGCGAGQVLVELQKRLPTSTSFVGYEISPFAFQLASPKANNSLQFKLGNFMESQGNPFDLLLVLDVLEHVSDYLGFLQAMRRKARRVLFHIPLELTVHSLLRDVLMLNRNTFGHLHHFTKDTALATLRDCGYGVHDRFYTPTIDRAKPYSKTAISNFVRRTTFWIAPDKSVLLLGGYALMVLTTTDLT
jgi:SAM-dependent methyltransferase